MMGCAPGTCGCCTGVAIGTPATIDNPPGQPEIRYRVGTQPAIKASLLARLSSTGAARLAGLTTRADTDFSIALCDGLATMLSVLTFYQERIANEHYLGTATERKSIVELARLIGYQPAPGCAASCHLAFTLQATPGATTSYTVPSGTRVQSVPGTGETAQSFETIEEIAARPDWNAIPVQTSIPWKPTMGDTDLWLAGVDQNLAAGDVILIVGDERLNYGLSESWDVRVVESVEPDAPNGRTRLVWSAGLGNATRTVGPAQDGVRVYAFRLRAPIFGHNAPDPRLLGDVAKPMMTGNEWTGFTIPPGDPIRLDAAYPKIVPGSWIAVASNSGGQDRSGLAGYVEVSRTSQVSFRSYSSFAVSGKTTEIVPDYLENRGYFTQRRTIQVHAQSEELPTIDRPLLRPLYGDVIPLALRVDDLVAGQAVAVRGPRARIQLQVGAPSASLTVDGGVTTLVEGDSLRMAGPPETPLGSGWVAIDPAEFEQSLLASPGGAKLRFTLLDRDGGTGTAELDPAQIELVPAEKDDEIVSEVAFVAKPDGLQSDRDRTTLTVKDALAFCYDLAAVRVCANVAAATHGETVTEILGSGDARVPNATFALRQSPLTYVSASTPTGRASTLEVRVNDLEWHEVETLYGADPIDRSYVLMRDEAEATTVHFGDGVGGARPASGDHNVRAIYRKGLGLAGNVDAGAITTLLSRPLGVTAAVNPDPATGGEDAEDEDRARENAPLTVLTLGRAVSIRDYQDYARAFAGIAKAHALWISYGPARGVFITVAGEEGAEVPEDGTTFQNLLASLRKYGDPLMPLRIRNYTDSRFRLRVAVQVADDADPEVVLPKVEAALGDAFAFEARSFGQMVSMDEVFAIVQQVAGVVAADLRDFARTGDPVGTVRDRIVAALPVAAMTGLPAAAELLTLDPGRLTVEAMS